MAVNNENDMNNFDVPEKYDVRPGCIDYGKEYEIKLATLFSLLCTHSDNDMWIGMNVNDCGDFDDIVLYRKTRAGKNGTLMIQVKHEERGKDLTQQQFSAAAGNFSFKKYSVSLSAIKEAIDGKTKTSPIINHLKQDHEKIFIIFTNKGVHEYKFLPEVKEDSFLNILNINGKIRKPNFADLPFQFQTKENSEEFMKNLLFFTKQSNIKQVDKSITDAMKKLLEPLKLSGGNMISLIDKFTRFVDDWSKGHLGGHYPLTKAHVLKVLASLLLEPYQAELEEPKEDSLFETSIWDEMTNTKTVTIIDADETSIQFVNQYVYYTTSKNVEKSEMNMLWARNRRLVNKTMLKVVPYYKTININNAYEYLWKSKQVPLVLKVNDTQNFEKLHHILKIAAEAFRVIILITIDSELPHLNFHNSFTNLQDVNKKYQQGILRRSVKLQGRLSNPLETLVTEELFQFITAKDIIYILLDKFKIGEDPEPLPEFFIDRSIPKVCIRGKALEEVKNDIFVIKCPSTLKFNRFLNKYKLRICNSSIFQKNETDIDAATLNQFRIIISDEDVDLEKMKIVNFQNKALHCLILHDSRYLEWKKSVGSISAIRPFRLLDHALATNKKKIYSTYNDDEPSSSFYALSDNDSAGSETELDNISIGFKNTTNGSINHENAFRAASVKCNLEANKMKEIVEVFSRKYITIPLVISADPGMGKSVLMDYIALSIPTNVWVVRINLVQHIKYYDREDFENLTPDEHLDYFNKDISEENKIGCGVFKKYLEKKNIILLFDGFDEIPIVSRENVIKTVKCLHDSGYFICVTTRPVAKMQLEDAFNTFAVDLVPFSETNQITFLIHYFNTFVSSNVENSAELIKLFVKKLLNATKKNFNAFDNEFMGVPLQTKLLSEVFTNDCETFLSTNTFVNDNFDMFYLYKNFITKKEKIICDKFGEFSKDEYNGYTNYRSLLALQLLFEENDLEELKINKQLQTMSKFIPYILQKVQRDGIIVAENESNIWFAHRTFAEYISAQWLSDNIDGEYKHLVQKLVQKLFQPNYSVVRNLYDRIMAQGCAVHLHVINGCIYEVKQNISSNPYIINEVDKCGRTALHLMAAWGIRHPHTVKSSDEVDILNNAIAKDPIVNCLKTLSIKLNNIKDSLGYTPLDYALFSRSYNIANVICSQLENYNDYICTSNGECELIYYYLQNNDFQYRSLMSVMLRNIVSADINTTVAMLRLINSHYNEITRTIQDLPNLLTSGASNIDEINDDGYTLLNAAVMLERKETVYLLLSQDSNVNFQDKTGKTALHWASAKGDVYSVHYLLSKSAKVNVIDNIGMTPIHYAFLVTTPDQNDIVTMLLEKEAAVNIQDNYGNTALQYCVYYSSTNTRKTVINHITKQTKHTNASSENNFNLHEVVLNMNCKSETIAHWAAENNLVDILSLFKDFPELSILQDYNGYTPLHFAAMRGHTESAKLLLSSTKQFYPAASDSSVALPKRVVMEMRDNKGQTALHIAVAGGHLKFVDFLLSEGGNVEATDDYGYLALHISAEAGHVDIASLLLSEGAYVEAKDDKNRTALHISTENGHLDIVSLLLSNGAAVDAKGDKNFTALHIATQKGHLEIASLLLRKGADVNTTGNNNYTALHTATQNGHLDIALLLLAKGAEVDRKTSKKNSALYIAAQTGHLDIASVLLSKGANVDAKNDRNWSPLHIAAYNAHLNIALLLLAEGTDPNAKTSKNHSALFIAAQNGHLDIASLLLSKGADVDAKNDRNWSALHISAKMGYLDIAALLLSKGADVDAKGDKNFTPLHIAVENGNVDIALLLLSHGADVDAKGDKNFTPLHIATEKGHLNIASLLLSKGADLDAKGDKNFTALHIAAENGHFDIALLYLSKEADAFAKGDKNFTALHFATERGHSDIASLLLSKGVDVDAKGDKNFTALHFATEKGQLGIASLLLSHGADVDAKGDKNFTPLHIAVENGNVDIALLLLTHGADVDAKGDKNFTPLHIATEKGHLEIASLLLSNGVDVDAKDDAGNTALYYAAKAEDMEMLALLSSERAGIQQNDEDDLIQF